MTESIPQPEDREPGRYMLLPEDPAVTAAPDPRRPRIRRYRLTRFPGDGSAAGPEPLRRAADCGHPRRPQD